MPESKNGEFFTCQRVLSIMVMVVFMVQHMLRVNITIAIVDMSSSNSSNLTRHFSWNEKEKNEILGSFFWGYMPVTLIGGRLTEMYGSKIVLGASLITSSIMTLLTPVASYSGYYWLLALAVRAGLGASLGVMWPSLPPIAAKWIPSKDKSKFMGYSATSALGAALALPLCGYLIAHFGWPSVFYVTGAIVAVCATGWVYLVYDSPSKHPRISAKEQEYLESEVCAAENRLLKTPWKKILTSKPAWAIVVADTAFLFNYFTILNELPMYMHDILNYEIESSGVLSSLPYIAHYFLTFIFSYLADRWIQNKTFSLRTTRTIVTGLSIYGPGVLLVIQCFWGYNAMISNLVFTLCLGLMGGYAAGFYANCLDIAPRYSGTIFGIANGCGAFAGYLSTEIVAQVTNENQNFEHWRYIFGVQIATSLFGGTFYSVFTSGELQSWNNIKSEEKKQKILENAKEEC